MVLIAECTGRTRTSGAACSATNGTERRPRRHRRAYIQVGADASNEEAESASRELETMRSRTLHNSSQEIFLHERRLRELQAELQQCRIERDEGEQRTLEEHIKADEARPTAD